MIHYLIMVLASLLLFGCAAQKTFIPSDAPIVSLCDLSQDPKAYAGKNIVVDGIIEASAGDYFIVQCQHSTQMKLYAFRSSKNADAPMTGQKVRVYGESTVFHNEPAMLLTSFVITGAAADTVSGDHCGHRGSGGSGGHSGHGASSPSTGGGRGGVCH